MRREAKQNQLAQSRRSCLGKLKEELESPAVILIRLFGWLSQFIRRILGLFRRDASQGREQAFESRRVLLHLIRGVMRPIWCGVLFLYQHSEQESRISVARVITKEREHFPGMEKFASSPVDFSEQVYHHAGITFGQAPTKCIIEIPVGHLKQFCLRAKTSKFSGCPRAT